MTKIFFSILMTFLVTGAHALEQCKSTSISKSRISYQDSTMKITFIEGEVARQKYHEMASSEQAPRPETFDADYISKAIITAKYGETETCWKIQMPKYLEGSYVGPSTCLSFSCNLIER